MNGNIYKLITSVYNVQLRSLPPSPVFTSVTNILLDDGRLISSPTMHPDPFESSTDYCVFEIITHFYASFQTTFQGPFSHHIASRLSPHQPVYLFRSCSSVNCLSTFLNTNIAGTILLILELSWSTVRSLAWYFPIILFFVNRTDDMQWYLCYYLRRNSD